MTEMAQQNAYLQSRDNIGSVGQADPSRKRGELNAKIFLNEYFIV